MTIPALGSVATAAGVGITLGSLLLNQGSPDANGVELLATDVTGWDSPTLRSSVDDRALAHGAHRGQSYYGSREIQIKGVLLGSQSSRAALEAAADDLAYETDLTDRDAVFTVHDAHTKRALVRREGRLLLQRDGDSAWPFDLTLTAVDPRRYSVDEHTIVLTPGQSAVASNVGTFRAGTPLTVQFTGPATDLTLSVDGVPLGVSSVVAGETITVDALAGTVLGLGGVTRYGRLLPGSVLPVLAAKSSAVLQVSGSGGSVTVKYRDAWL